MNISPQPLIVNLHNHKFKNSNDLIMRTNPEHPVQCFSANKLKERIDLFQDNFPGEVSYAVKANATPLVIKTAAIAGLTTFDVASPAEMELVSQHAPNAKIHYHNPVRSLAETQQAWQQYQCKRFAVDELSQLDKVTQVVGNPQGIEIAVRFRLPASSKAVHDFSTKFGASVSDASKILSRANLLGFTPVLTFHPGSQCLDPASWREHIIAAANIAKTASVKIAKLNVGGGFPVDYAAHQAPDLNLFFNSIEQTATHAFGSQDRPALECEPGRALVGPTISVLTKVKMVRHASREIYLNDGIYGNLMESSQSPTLQPIIRVISKSTTTEQAPYTVYGPTCDPLDHLPGPINLPIDIAEDDYIEFQNLGAYGTATSTNFNGYGSSRMVEVSTL